MKNFMAQCIKAISKFEMWGERNWGWIVAFLCAALAGGLVISLRFSVSNTALAVSLASAVMAIIAGAAGMTLKDKALGFVTLAGIIITAGVFMWGVKDAARPNEHTISITGVEMGFVIDHKDCDFSDPTNLVCKLR
ncbi:hypothetical protein [Pseudomonas coronafaciens]|uniref:Uncharacterized protein n=1 Tax=Pseudomonas coronafaciens pv. coronafaciens TaxID=235275 RepID=A0AAE6QG68_9PSED|nr:hypothetical protein [Pseudomonas coronafaciens]QGT82059.1 hypothetical protein GMO17_13105 [Pseudomonas coronafaciens pv. coronafaciens]